MNNSTKASRVFGWLVSMLALMCVLASPARAEEQGELSAFVELAKLDIERLGLTTRWAIVGVSVIDATGQGIHPETISGPLHAALVINSASWRGKRWKFVPIPFSSNGTALHAWAIGFNAFENVTKEVLRIVGGILENQSLVVQLFVVVTPADIEYVIIGGYRKANGARRAVFRMYSGDLERGADEVLRIAKDAMEG